MIKMFPDGPSVMASLEHPNWGANFAHLIHACVCINVPDYLDFDHRLGATNVGGEYPSSCKVPFFCILQSWRDTLVLHLVKFKSGLLDPWWLSMCKQNYFFIRDGAKLFKN